MSIFKTQRYSLNENNNFKINPKKLPNFDIISNLSEISSKYIIEEPLKTYD